VAAWQIRSVLQAIGLFRTHPALCGISRIEICKRNGSKTLFASTGRDVSAFDYFVPLYWMEDYRLLWRPPLEVCNLIPRVRLGYKGLQSLAWRLLSLLVESLQYLSRLLRSSCSFLSTCPPYQRPIKIPNKPPRPKIIPASISSSRFSSAGLYILSSKLSFNRSLQGAVIALPPRIENQWRLVDASLRTPVMKSGSGSIGVRLNVSTQRWDVGNIR